MPSDVWGETIFWEIAMFYRYQVAGISVLCEIPFSITITRESQAFLQTDSPSEPADLDAVFTPASTLPDMPPGGHWEVCQYHVQTSRDCRVYHSAVPRGTPYACVLWPKTGAAPVQCLYLADKADHLAFSRNICDLLGLERLLLSRQGLLLHASFIRWQDRGILFSAPSGTGKSTQADLWVRHRGAEVINGDRAALRRSAGRWRAYGLPYAGSSGVYRNESAEISALVVLRQGPENRLRDAGPAEAFAALFPELTVHRWEPAFVEQAADLLLAVLDRVPVYRLECRPDREAVELLCARVLQEAGET